MRGSFAKTFQYQGLVQISGWHGCGHAVTSIAGMRPRREGLAEALSEGLIPGLLVYRLFCTPRDTAKLPSSATNLRMHGPPQTQVSRVGPKAEMAAGTAIHPQTSGNALSLFKDRPPSMALSEGLIPGLLVYRLFLHSKRH